MQALQARELSKYEQIFLKIAKAYVKYYPKYSFRFQFNDLKYPVVGKSDYVVDVKFLRSKHVLKRIFTEGSLGLGESYAQGLIQVRNGDYKKLLFLFVRAANDKRFIKKLPLLDILRILRIKFSAKFFELHNK